MKLGEINIFRGVDTTTALGEYSTPSLLDYVKDTSDTLGYGAGITNVGEVTNIFNQTIQSTSISNFYDVSTSLPNAPEGAYMTMGADGVWTYSVETEFVLQAATDTVLGGIIVGPDFSITDGVLSINPTGLPVVGTPVDDSFVRITTDANGRVTATSAITASDITDLIGVPVLTETDPVFLAHVAHGITANQISHWDLAWSWGDWSTEGFLTEFTETDPIFTAWDKSTGISITASQVSNFTASVNANTHVAAAYNAIHSAVTIGTANGLSIAGQAVSMTVADSTHTGALSSTDWNRFDSMIGNASFQPLEDQRLSTTDDVTFDVITGSYLTSTAITDDSTALGSLAGFDTGDGTIRKFSPTLVQEWLGLGPNAYTDTEYYLATNPTAFVHEITSEDGTVVITDNTYVDTTLHGYDLSVTPLFRYTVVATSGSEVSVLATKEDITATLSGQLLSYTIPEGTRLISSKIRFGGYSSLTVNMGTNDMPNSSVADKWIPMVQAWREDTRAQLMVVNVVPSGSVHDEVTINGLINTTTNHIRLQF